MNRNMRKEQLLQVYAALRENGYDPIGQIVGYILSDDPTYITNYKGSRALVSRIEREELLKDILVDYLKSESFT